MAARSICLLCAIALAAGLAVPEPARAQLGTSANPPASNLFQFKDLPQRRDTGLGTGAETRMQPSVRPKPRRTRPRPAQ